MQSWEVFRAILAKYIPALAVIEGNIGLSFSLNIEHNFLKLLVVTVETLNENFQSWL